MPYVIYLCSRSIEVVNRRIEAGCGLNMVRVEYGSMVGRLKGVGSNVVDAFHGTVGRQVQIEGTTASN